jgi:hypothetical protein
VTIDAEFGRKIMVRSYARRLKSLDVRTESRIRFGGLSIGPDTGGEKKILYIRKNVVILKVTAKNAYLLL